jgi:hypothetical protein
MVLAEKPIPVLLISTKIHTGFPGIKSSPLQWDGGTESWHYTMTVYWRVKVHHEDVCGVRILLQ